MRWRPNVKVSLFQTPLIRPEREVRDAFRWNVEQCVVADQVGLEEAFIGEHATMRWENVPNPELVISAAALETERVILGPLAHLLPYHNPSSLAIQTGWLSNILEGRYILGIGAGAYPTDAALRGHADMSENFPMLLEAVEIMERVWNREPFQYQGKYFRAGFPEDDPHHPISNHAPYGGNMTMAVTGLSANSPSIRFAGTRGWIPCSVYTGEPVLKTHWTSYEEGAIANGITPDRSLHHVLRDVFVADTDAEARKLAINGGIGHAWSEYLLPIYKQLGMLGPLLAAAGTPDAEADVDFLCEHVWLVGSPDTVAAKLNAAFERTGGWGTLMVQAHDYIDNPEPWNESLRLLAQEVAPKVGEPTVVTAT
jgi:3,6-diketocamphane 1,6-monooxygenase